MKSSKAPKSVSRYKIGTKHLAPKSRRIDPAARSSVNLHGWIPLSGL
jgi:hypothetical protein